MTKGEADLALAILDKVELAARRAMTTPWANPKHFFEIFATELTRINNELREEHSR